MNKLKNLQMNKWTNEKISKLTSNSDEQMNEQVIFFSHLLSWVYTVNIISYYEINSAQPSSRP